MSEKEMNSSFYKPSQIDMVIDIKIQTLRKNPP